MTECERFIKEGRFPKSFFEIETRCGYTISAEMKKIWAIEMDLFLRFAEVCDKYNLKYGAFGGTLLGAVRHNGFIPWDDDMDVYMLRDDYMRFIEVAPKEFKSPYFFQSPETDDGYYFAYIRLRNSNTTGAETLYLHNHYNHGVSLDIFPLDHVNPSTAYMDRYHIYDCIMKCASYMKRTCVGQLNERQLENFHKYQTDKPLEEYRKITSIASNPTYRNTGFLTHATFFSNVNRIHFWNTEWYEKTILHPFETIEIPIPIGYHNILTEHFGDYMQYPPLENRYPIHDGTIWDPDKSFIEYLK